MSYEGYVRLLCKKGHLIEIDCHDDEPKKCWCGEEYVWRNDVDVTNGSFEGDEGGA